MTLKLKILLVEILFKIEQIRFKEKQAWKIEKVLFKSMQINSENLINVMKNNVKIKIL